MPGKQAPARRHPHLALPGYSSVDISSSTFWIALCTNRPIVLVELGYSYLDTFFTEEIRPAIERRVRFVRAHNDDRNRLVVNEEELEHAILTAPETVTSAELQTLLIGEAR